MPVRSVSPVQSTDFVPLAWSSGRLKKGAFDETLSRGPGFGRHPGQQQAGEIAEGQAGFTHGGHDQGVGALTLLYCSRRPGLVRGRLQSIISRAMKPRARGETLQYA